MEQMCCLPKPHRLAEAETQIASYMQTSSESRQFRNRILQPWPACMELRLGVGVYPREEEMFGETTWKLAPRIEPRWKHDEVFIGKMEKVTEGS